MLDEKIHLSQCVQDLAIPLTMRGESKCTQIHEITERTAPLRKVALPSGHIDKVLPAIQKVANSELRALQVFGATLIQIIQAYASCSIIELRISQGTWSQMWGEDSFRPYEHTPLSPLSELDIDSLEERKGTVEIVHLVRIQATPESLSKFIHWPHTLTELHFFGMQDSRCRGQYSLEEFTKFFDVHKTTLRHIRVGIIPRERNDLIRHSVIDVSSYPELRSLVISNQGLFKQQPAVVAKRLLSLKTQDILSDIWGTGRLIISTRTLQHGWSNLLRNFAACVMKLQAQSSLLYICCSILRYLQDQAQRFGCQTAPGHGITSTH